jgi:hypothetical protein
LAVAVVETAVALVVQEEVRSFFTVVEARSGWLYSSFFWCWRSEPWAAVGDVGPGVEVLGAAAARGAVVPGEGADDRRPRAGREEPRVVPGREPEAAPAVARPVPVLAQAPGQRPEGMPAGQRAVGRLMVAGQPAVGRREEDGRAAAPVTTVWSRPGAIAVQVKV